MSIRNYRVLRERRRAGTIRSGTNPKGDILTSSRRDAAAAAPSDPPSLRLATRNAEPVAPSGHRWLLIRNEDADLYPQYRALPVEVQSRIQELVRFFFELRQRECLALQLARQGDESADLLGFDTP